MPTPLFHVPGLWHRSQPLLLLLVWSYMIGNVVRLMNLLLMIWTTSNLHLTTWSLHQDHVSRRQERGVVFRPDKVRLVDSVCVDKRPAVELEPVLDLKEDKTLSTDDFPNSSVNQLDLDIPRRFTTLSNWINWITSLLEVHATVSYH